MPLENIVGFASDECNTMYGHKNSVTSRLKNHLPGIILQKCICHSLHGENVIVTNLHETMCIAYKDFLSIVINPTIICSNSSELYNIDLDNSVNYIPIDQIYLGLAVNNILQKNEFKDKKIVTEFKAKAREIILTACKQIKLRYDFYDQTMIHISCLLIKVALRHDTNHFQSLINLMSCLIRVTPKDNKLQQAIDDQWRKLPLVSLPDDILNETSVEKFW